MFSIFAVAAAEEFPPEFSKVIASVCFLTLKRTYDDSCEAWKIMTDEKVETVWLWEGNYKKLECTPIHAKI